MKSVKYFFNNKVILSIFSVILFAFFGVFLVGCGDITIKSMTINQGTLETTVLRGTELDTSKTVAVVTYSDNTTKTVEAKDLVFGSIDTSTVGNKILTITYTDDEERTISINFAVNVVASENDVLSISRLESALLNEFNSNRTASGQYDSFKDQEQPLYVGDDNAFNFRINAAGYDADGTFVPNIINPKVNITVEIIGDNPLTADKEADDAKTVLTGTSLAHFVAINEDVNTLQFSQNAVGYNFYVTVEAANKDITAEENATKFETALTVVDAFNVYTASDLMVYDNYYSYYTQKRQELGLPSSVNGVILQADISITKDDVRQEMFWTEKTPNYSTAIGYSNYVRDNLLGSPIDASSDKQTGIYRRNIANGETFNFIGNYFSVNLSQFPLMVVELDGSHEENYVNSERDPKNPEVFIKEKYMTSHTCVFYTWTANDVDSETKVNWKNLNFIGNSAISNDPKYSGGILLMKNNAVDFYAYNTLMNNFYIGYFMQMGEVNNDYNGEYIIDSCKGYNSYQCLIYAWGSEHFIIKNSEFKTSGGPAIISDHSHIDENAAKPAETGNPSNIDIIASTIESVVTAQSPWFITYGADAIMKGIPLIDKMLDGSMGLPATDKTILAGSETIDGQPYQKLNIIAVAKSGGSTNLDVAAGGFDIRGYIRIFNTEDDYNKYYGLGDYEGNPDTSVINGLDLGNDIYQSAKGNTHYIQDSVTGGYINQNILQNKDGTLFKLSVMKTVVNAVLDGAKEKFPSMATTIDAIKINDANFNAADLNGKRTMLKTVLQTLASIATYAETLIDTVYGALLTNGQIFGAISNWSELEGKVDEKVTALSAEIDKYTDTVPSNSTSLNIYTDIGIGAIIGLYPRTSTTTE